MAHRSRLEVHKFECGHRGLGKYCHFCKDIKAGRATPRKKTEKNEEGQVVAVVEKKYWQKAKCPFCNGNRVKKNEMNAFSPTDMKEYRCTSFECGKQFNTEQVKEFEQVEVVDRPRTPYNPRLTD